MRRSSMLVVGLILATATAALVYAKKDKPKEAPAPAKGADVVAYVGDEAITKDDLDKAASGQLMRVRQQEYEIRQNALDALIQKKLLDNEAATRKIAVADLLKMEIEDKSPNVEASEIDAFYEQNKARMGNRTREDVGPDIERQLQAQKQAERRNAFINELAARSSVKVLLEPPRLDVPVPEGAFAKGPATAPVTIVEFSDYQCPFCRRAHPTVEQLLADYGDKIRFVYRDYPLNFHPRAVPASVAARCAADQGKFWEYHNNLMVNQGDLSDTDLSKRAADLGLDEAEFATCTTEKRHEDAIQASFEDGAALGVTGTPAFFINGRAIVGARPVADFKQVIDDELSRLEGTKATN